MLKVLLGATLIVVLLYVVAGGAIAPVVSLGGDGPSEGDGGGRLGYSPFQVTFREQYLCYSVATGDWEMRGRAGEADCRGPFLDSASLCRTMAEEGVSRVRLFWEGRTLDCP